VTEHSEPRRWEQGTFDGVVHWREDTATQPDIDATADWLENFVGEILDAGGTDGRSSLADARSLLSTIFKEGGEGS
jgi:hypothetical protein